MAIYALGDRSPEIHPEAYVHPDAMVIGDVMLGPEATVWPQAVLRGDYGRIEVGRPHQHPGRCGDPRHPRLPDGDRRRGGGRSPGPPGVLHREWARPGRDRLDRAAPGGHRAGALVGAGAVVPNDMVVPSRGDGARRAGEAAARHRRRRARSSPAYVATQRYRSSSAASTDRRPMVRRTDRAASSRFSPSRTRTSPRPVPSRTRSTSTPRTEPSTVVVGPRVAPLHDAPVADDDHVLRRRSARWATRRRSPPTPHDGLGALVAVRRSGATCPRTRSRRSSRPSPRRRRGG